MEWSSSYLPSRHTVSEASLPMGAVATASDRSRGSAIFLPARAVRKAGDKMRREEEERHEQYVLGMTALYNRERDIALAAYDGEAAAEAIVALAEAIHGANIALVLKFLNSEAETLFKYGRDRGSNVHLVATIALRRKTLVLAVSSNERGAAYDNLGNALETLGERESGTARLEEAVAAYRAALEERTRERVPLDWAMTQNNLGNALWRLGERESGTARLEQAVAACRAALEERTRERVPLDWALTHNSLGSALQSLGERESGTEALQAAPVFQPEPSERAVLKGSRSFSSGFS